jgi:SPP1 gp7 family putative phage head morphogenesis protein
LNKREKEVLQAQLDSEKKVLKQLEKQYQAALDEINDKILLLQSKTVYDSDGYGRNEQIPLNALPQSRIYQIEHQKALKGQIEGIIEKLHSEEYETIQQYLEDCYVDSFVGTAYDLAGQGIPLIMPIDQAAAVRAIQTDSKISAGLYDALGVDTKNLKKAIAQEATRGVASGLTYADIARNIQNVSNVPISNAKRIARTEGHRIQQASTMDAQKTAKTKGADVVKQWDASLDGKTRDTHRKLDGQIREVDEPFEMDGKKAMFPGDFGDPAEDCNCRCASLTRARWGLDEDELKTLQDRAEYFGLDKTKDFNDFKKKYLKTLEENTETYTMNGVGLQFFASSKAYKTVILPKKEYAHVMSELATHMTEEQRKKKVVKKAIGKYIYTVENNGFGDYRIIGKKQIDSKKYDDIGW